LPRKDKRKSAFVAINSVFDSLFGEFSVLIRFFIGWFAFMAIFMAGPMLLMKLYDWFSPSEKIDKTEPLKTDSVYTIISMEEMLREIDSVFYKLEEETAKKRNILKNKIDEFQKVTEANFLVDSIRKEYGITKKLTSTTYLSSTKNYLNWIISAIITLIGGGFFYMLGRRAERKKSLKKNNTHIIAKKSKEGKS